MTEMIPSFLLPTPQCTRGGVAVGGGPLLITPAAQALNAHHHSEDDNWGKGAKHYVDVVHKMISLTGSGDILDYGCGKGSLQELLGFPIKEYDPGIPGKNAPATPADIVVCASVLEHVEPDCLDGVLDDIRRCTKQLAFFVIPHNQDLLGLHLSVHPQAWWLAKLTQHGFAIKHAMEFQSLPSEQRGHLILGSRTFCLTYPV